MRRNLHTPTYRDVIERVQAEFYTYAEAASVLGIGKMTLWRWVKAGKVPVYHVGREVLIEKRLVEELKAKR